MDLLAGLRLCKMNKMPDDFLDRPLAAFDPLLDDAPFKGPAEIEGKPVLKGFGAEEYGFADDLLRDKVLRPADIALDPFPLAVLEEIALRDVPRSIPTNRTFSCFCSSFGFMAKRSFT